MLYTGQSPIVGPQTPIDIDDLIFHYVQNGAKRPEELESYFATLWEGSKRLGFDFGVMAAQWDVETGGGTSSWWEDGLNPAGLGITGDPAQNAKAQTWDTGEEAAQAHLAHMAAYVYGDGDYAWPNAWRAPNVIDERYDLVPRTGPKKPARTLSDLNQTWAIDPENDYHGKLAARANRIVEVAGKPDVTIPDGEDEEVPMQVKHGLVPHPIFVDRTEALKVNLAWDDLGERIIRRAFWHTMYGTLWGTDGYFQGEARLRALTDYGVGNAADDGASNDGKILMWNNPRGRRSPYANGPLDNPVADGKAFADRWGRAAINRDAVSIERSGRNGNIPLSAKAKQAIAEITAYWADQYGKYLAAHGDPTFTWETFPLIPSEGSSFVIHHGEVNGDKRDTCPGPVVEAATNEIIAMAKEIMRRYQTSAAPVPEPIPIPLPTYPEPVMIPALRQMEGADPNTVKAIVTTEGTDFVFVNDWVRATKATPRLQRANKGAKHIGPMVAEGAEFEVTWLFTAKDGKRYYLTPWGSRIQAADTERVRDAA